MATRTCPRCARRLSRAKRADAVYCSRLCSKRASSERRLESRIAATAPPPQPAYANFWNMATTLLQKELENEVFPALMLGEREFHDAVDRAVEYFMEFGSGGVSYPLVAQAAAVESIRSWAHASGLIGDFAAIKQRAAEIARQEVVRESFFDGMTAGYRSAIDNFLDMFLDNEPQFRGIAAFHKEKRAVAPEPTPEPEPLRVRIAEDYRRGEPREACSVNWDGKPVSTPDCGWLGAQGGWVHSGACNQRQRRHRTQTNS